MTTTTDQQEQWTIDYVCRESESYNDYQNRARLAAKYMLKYLERNDYPGIYGMRYDARDGRPAYNLQWLIRGTEVREITYMYSRMRDLARKFRRTTKEKDWSFNLPLWPLLSDLLDQDTTSHIFSFLDDFSFETVTKVSKEFYHALVPRQRRVNLSGCSSFGIVGLLNFVGAEYFSGRENSDLVTDTELLFLASSQPRLAHVDLGGCKYISMHNTIKLLSALGPRLKSLELGCHGECLHMGHRLAEAISTAPSLESLMLTLNHNSRQAFDFSCFNGHKRLRVLTLTVDGPITGGPALPSHLPNLECLKLDIVDQATKPYWRLLGNFQSPKLKQLDLTVTSYAFPEMRLHADMLISILMKIPSLESIVIRRVKRCSPLDGSIDLKSVDIPAEMVHVLDDMVRVLDENHRDIKFEEQEVKRLQSFARKRNIQCVVHNDNNRI